jgi:hypothetical protein
MWMITLIIDIKIWSSNNQTFDYRICQMRIQWCKCKDKLANAFLIHFNFFSKRRGETIVVFCAFYVKLYK